MYHKCKQEKPRRKSLLFVGILSLKIRAGSVLKHYGSGTLVPLVQLISFSRLGIVQDERNRTWVWEEEAEERRGWARSAVVLSRTQRSRSPSSPSLSVSTTPARIFSSKYILYLKNSLAFVLIDKYRIFIVSPPPPPPASRHCYTP
jgi:hypothetical protein